MISSFFPDFYDLQVENPSILAASRTQPNPAANFSTRNLHDDAMKSLFMTFIVAYMGHVVLIEINN